MKPATERNSIRKTKEVLVIHGYSDHAANERTFLAWVRTGVAVIAFGFVIEKFNLFVLTMAAANLTGSPGRIARTRRSQR